MKAKILIVIFLVTAAAVAGTMTRSMRDEENGSNSSVSYQNNEIRESYQLQPGADVQVSGINGPVEIETAETDTAEVYVQRSAGSQEELNRRRVIIEHSPTSLTIRTEQSRSFNFWNWWGSKGHERVVLKLPRKISLMAKGVNGKVTVGEVDGTVHIKGINGRVETAQASNATEVKGVNGPVLINVRQLGGDGLQISGINGGIEIRLSDGLNADFQAKGMNGGVSSDLPGVSIQRDDERSRYSARIGNGGAPITLSGINGSVRFTRAS